MSPPFAETSTTSPSWWLWQVTGAIGSATPTTSAKIAGGLRISTAANSANGRIVGEKIAEVPSASPVANAASGRPLTRNSSHSASRSQNTIQVTGNSS